MFTCRVSRRVVVNNGGNRPDEEWGPTRELRNDRGGSWRGRNWWSGRVTGKLPRWDDWQTDSWHIWNLLFLKIICAAGIQRNSRWLNCRVHANYCNFIFFESYYPMSWRKNESSELDFNPKLNFFTAVTTNVITTLFVVFLLGGTFQKKKNTSKTVTVHTKSIGDR